MDQLKDFLRQCVKYRFWIAFGVSLLLPIVGYFVGVGAITQATTTRENEIKGAKADIGKYTAQGIINGQYQPIAAQKKEALTKDVDATWRKLFTVQEPLLKWPEDVEARFRKWGRKFPGDVDKGQVQSTLIDYTIAYPNFVNKVYKTFKPFNFEDGTGIVAAPDEKILLRPAPFSADAPPELGKVWAEQERLWVVTALLDVVAKVNDGVGAKDWDGAIVKQLNLVEVGAQTDQDQVSIVKNQALVPSDPLLPEGAPPPPPPTNAAPAAPGDPRGGGMMGMAGGAAGQTDEVYYIKTEGQQFKSLPIKMVALVDQSKLADFLVGLENSPMAIQVMEIEIAKPLTPVVKPVYGEKSAINMGGMMGGMMGGPGMAGMTGSMSGMNESSAYAAMMRNQGNRNMGGGGPGMAGAPKGSPYGSEGMMSGGPPAAAKKGVDIRSVNKAAERKKSEKEAAKAKPDSKSKADQYFNIIEVTVYGQARFYLAPPPAPEPPPSTAVSAPPATPEPAKVEAPKADEPAKKVEEPKKDEAPKAAAPEPKADAPKVEPPKPEAPKADDPAPRR